MKSVLFIVAAALALPLPAAAQSLNDTHELAWHPAGKAPHAYYRERNRAECTPTAGHHQAGKSLMVARAQCLAAKRKPATPAFAATSPAPAATQAVVAD
ncbi:MAG: hypothetical protein WC816_13760 [Sphingomonas sp.]|jgi:hypothetical protein